MNIVLASRRKYMRKRTNPEGAPASVEDCIVSLVRDSFPYTGQAITPQVTVTTQDGVPLVVNIDYFVSYSDNVNVGAGTVTVTGAGEYVGSVTKTFQITSAAPSTGWDFDLSKLSSPASSGVPDDGRTNNEIRGMYMLSDGRLSMTRRLSAGSEYYNVVCGFDSEHKLDPAYFVSPSFVSRTSSSADRCIMYSEDGTVAISAADIYGYWRSYELDTPFDYSTKHEIRARGFTNVGSVSKNKEGTDFIYAVESRSRYVYHRNLSVGYDPQSTETRTSIYLESDDSFVVLCASEDGKNFVTADFRSDSFLFKKFAMENAWDVENAVLVSTSPMIQIENATGVASIAIDNGGTVMLVSALGTNTIYKFDLVK